MGLHDGMRYAAVIDRGRPTDIWAERAERPDLVDSIFVGKTGRVDRTVGAVWVDIGLDRPAMMSLCDRAADDRSVPVGGSVLPIQITGDPRDGKPASATRDIALVGRFLVLMPFGRGLAISRRLKEPGRQRWTQILPPPTAGGWIVRSAAGGASDDAVADEAAFLLRRWSALAERCEAATQPMLIEAAPGVHRRSILDVADIGAVRADSETLCRELRAWLRIAAGDLAPRLAVEMPVVPDILATLCEPEVSLPGGGRLTIESTRALTAVDVDMGSATDRVAVNRAAAREVAAQLRLRNIGGLIVVDFISMRDPGQRKTVFAELRAAVAGDRMEPRLGRGLSPFGLAEISRRRRGRSLGEVMGA